MKGIGDDKTEDAPKKTVAPTPTKVVEKTVSQEHPVEAVPAQAEKKFEGKGLA